MAIPIVVSFKPGLEALQYILSSAEEVVECVHIAQFEADATDGRFRKLLSQIWTAQTVLSRCSKRLVERGVGVEDFMSLWSDVLAAKASVLAVMKAVKPYMPARSQARVSESLSHAAEVLMCGHKRAERAYYDAITSRFDDQWLFVKSQTDFIVQSLEEFLQTGENEGIGENWERHDVANDPGEYVVGPGDAAAGTSDDEAASGEDAAGGGVDAEPGGAVVPEPAVEDAVQQVAGQQDVIARQPAARVIVRAQASWGWFVRQLRSTQRAMFVRQYEKQWELVKKAVVDMEEACERAAKLCKRIGGGPRRQEVYVHPAVLRAVVKALLQNTTQIVLLQGSPWLGKGALAKEIMWLSYAGGILSQAFGRSAYHVCKHGHLCVKDLYRNVLRHETPPELSDEDTARALAEYVREESMLLVLVDLEQAACFAEHGMLRSLVEDPGRSKLLVTSSTTALCDVLEPIHCQVHRLTAADNEANVMRALMLELALGSDAYGPPRVPPLTFPVPVSLQVPIGACVTQSQGNPQLLRLVIDYVRANGDQNPHSDPRGHNTLREPDYLELWQQCAGNFFVAINLAPGAAAAEASIRHSYLQLVLRALEHAPHAPDAQHAADMPPYQLALCGARAVLRVIAHADALKAWSWYRWSEIVAEAVNCRELDWMPHVAQPGFGDRFSTAQRMVLMQAQRIMVNNGLFEVHTGRWDSSDPVLRYSVLLQRCLRMEEAAQEQIGPAPAAPPAPSYLQAAYQAFSEIRRQSTENKVARWWYW